MKNVLISLAALAALSTAAPASDRGHDRSDSDINFGKYSTQLKANKYSNASSSAETFAVEIESAQLTAFERMKKNAEENENGSK